nr:hypothetical protein BgiMline_016352 [Biomphalaria glabrata]
MGLDSKRSTSVAKGGKGILRTVGSEQLILGSGQLEPGLGSLRWAVGADHWASIWALDRRQWGVGTAFKPFVVGTTEIPFR